MKIRFVKNSNGSIIIELALVLPVLVMIIFGMYEIGTYLGAKRAMDRSSHALAQIFSTVETYGSGTVLTREMVDTLFQGYGHNWTAATACDPGGTYQPSGSGLNGTVTNSQGICSASGRWGSPRHLSCDGPYVPESLQNGNQPYVITYSSCEYNSLTANFLQDGLIESFAVMPYQNFDRIVRCTDIDGFGYWCSDNDPNYTN